MGPAARGLAECERRAYVEEEDEQGMPMTDVTPETTPTQPKRVIRNDEASRYEIWVGDTLAGFTEFVEKSGRRVLFPHTEIDSAFGGQGLGGHLVGDALADIAQRGGIIVPICPFVQKYLRKNEVAGAVIDWPDSADAQESATPGEQPA